MHATEQQKENAKLDHDRQILSEDITKKTNKTEELRVNFKTAKEKMTKELRELRKKIEEDTERKSVLERAIKVYEVELGMV